MKLYGARKIAQRSSSLLLSHLHLCIEKCIINVFLIHKLTTVIYEQHPFLVGLPCLKLDILNCWED